MNERIMMYLQNINIVVNDLILASEKATVWKCSRVIQYFHMVMISKR